MELPIITGCLIIVAARTLDVTLGTLRTAAIVQGRRGFAFFLGFIEMLIWVSVVLKLISRLDSPAYIVSYALGFAIGNFCGVSLDGWIGFGEQVIRIITRREDLISSLREAGYRVTEFEGKGREGRVMLLYLKIRRKETRKILALVREMDPNAFFAVEDVRMSSAVPASNLYPTGWRAIPKKK